jgi:hypothetical protein
MSERCFNQAVQLMKEIALADHKIPDNLYDMKKLVSGLSLPVHKINVCTNGCMLYRKCVDKRRDCKFCGHARYI